MTRPDILLRSALVAAVAALAAACASSGGVPRPFPRPGSVEVQPPAPAPARAPSPDSPTGAVIETALSLRGAPYRNGGTDPEGFDCSGFTQYVFGQHGVALPRETREQFDAGRTVGPDELEAGDLLFFSTVAPGPSHVAIAIGGDEFVHAPSSRGVVRVERLSSSYWSKRFLGARRMQ